MILLDPDLNPASAPRQQVPARSARRRVGAREGTLPAPGVSQLPSARVLTGFLRLAQTSSRLHGRVSVLLTTDSALRRLNRRFRHVDKPTDVLSFPAEAGTRTRENIAGDLAISVPAARRQAAAHGHALAVEIKILMLHGLLHLAGYDHESDDGQMARRERRLRAQLGLPTGLIERAGVSAVRGSASGRAGSRTHRPTAPPPGPRP